MTVHARHTHRKTKSLSDIFNHFVRETNQRFPKVKGQLLIMEMNEYKAYGCDDINSKKTGLTPKTAEEFLKRNTGTRDLLKANAKEEYASSWAHYNKKRKVHIIYANEKVDKDKWQRISKKKEQELLFSLDHELAHIVIKEADFEERHYGKDEVVKVIVAEAVADAYAQIRYYQRYGTQNEPASAYDSWFRTKNLTFDEDTDHFSTFMLDEIIKRKHLIDFAALTPQQTVDLAVRFAMQYTPPPAVIHALSKKFKPVQKAQEDAPKSNAWLKVLADITLDPANDHFTFKVGRKLLGGYLEGRSDTYEDEKPVRTVGKYWDDIREKLKEREDAFELEDILFNVPLVKHPHPPKPADQNKPKKPAHK